MCVPNFSLLACLEVARLVRLARLATWCFIMIDKKFELIAWARKQPISWDRCFFVDETYTFSYLVSKKFHDHLVIIHLYRLFKIIFVEIC